MLGKYRHRDFLTNGTGTNDSSIALRGGLNKDRLGSEKTGYTRIEDPFIPFITIDVDFTYSPFFGDMQKIINLLPSQYASYLESKLQNKYRSIVNGEDVNGIQLEPCKYNLDANYMVTTINGDMLSAAEWLYMKLCGVPSLDSNVDVADTNTPTVESDTAKYDEEADDYDQQLNDKLKQMVYVDNVDDADTLNEEIDDLEEAKSQASDNKQAVADSNISVSMPTSQVSFNDISSDYANIEDSRVADFIRSCKMFYELIKNHSYMISAVQLGDFIKEYYNNENNSLSMKLTMKFTETVDMKATRMMHGFMNALYDAAYMRAFIPENLRKFNMTVYIHDARSFLNNNPAGKMLSQLTNSNEVTAINSIAAEHTSTLALCLMGCKFTDYSSSIGDITISNITAGSSQDTVSVSIEADQTSIYMKDIHDLAFK